MTTPNPTSVGQIEGFVTLLRAACDDPGVRERLGRLLALPDEKRRALVNAWVSDLLIAQAPRDFTMAIACLLDDAVAARAREVLRNCRR